MTARGFVIKKQTMLPRRSFLRTLAAASIVPSLRAQEAEKFPPVRAITRRPKFHWFGYYDKFQFDPTDRFVLGNEVDFEGRSPKPDDVIRVGMVDLQDGDKWIELGESRAWNWQQGAMLQWVPGTESSVMWNDREGDRFVCRIMDVKTRSKRTIPHPIYALSPDGKWGVSPDFRRLNDTRPGYGYAGVPDPNRDTLAPEDAGIWKTDMETGKQSLLLSFADVAKVEQPGGFSKGSKHWFNHLLVAPGGKRFTFLHRWRGEAEGKSWKTRQFTVGADGRELHLLNPSGRVSHFVWRDATHILAYAGWDEQIWRFQVFEDRTNKTQPIEGMLPVDGHCTYLPGDEWILCDTYPDAERNQKPYLFHLPTSRLHLLGRFHSPKEYTGEWRCDTHPRGSRSGKFACIDSPHAGGRQMYLIDLRPITG
ncbi:MAG: hypothetical protein ABI464_03815 [Chthoniobacteraceae bacterium]